MAKKNGQKVLKKEKLGNQR